MLHVYGGEARMREAQISYSRETREITVAVPSGTKLADLARLIDFMAKDVFSKLPRACTNCTSGDHLIIREQLENVIKIDLDQRAQIK
jgi:hypothetical protein